MKPHTVEEDLSGELDGTDNTQTDIHSSRILD